MTDDARDAGPPHKPSRHSAVAIAYDAADAAPRVVAKGYGTVAENIMRTAREHGLYVHESPELVGLLMQVDLDRHIPPELYEAVARLLAWLYRLEAAPDAEA
ncbi:EscU/YscU/HrcU family type III secretion system export apparatus switch protein [Pusillimonas sp.]|uniref:EscU/YscU/HrcU family type III secretion system export apparatus switch protein n=1 Tax=Pusillimonas sp. TaxID=3040095 RepID=UPI0029B985FE|nr:EscU/YscU/HrcU family type III secretion system export apparatus switch protein [Pusillimonas sp.]MDX3894118.1 EscU/YscU/HrcU family type III secretion system export apparatus switch protein [Pusillimonas sp.]